MPHPCFPLTKLFKSRKTATKPNRSSTVYSHCATGSFFQMKIPQNVIIPTQTPTPRDGKNLFKYQSHSQANTFKTFNVMIWGPSKTGLKRVGTSKSGTFCNTQKLKPLKSS
eukprot:TRINITY_DN35127_c0_g1_i2.p1 TRINITY_DN35127_c0_g1~~TRINITY_DN35127_c0_g1_i2.p1  ORF type:complete len:111 (+),score=4.43 TRINITY_DN35127_c0_g1_i2:142-474(+)